MALSALKGKKLTKKKTTRRKAKSNVNDSES